MKKTKQRKRRTPTGKTKQQAGIQVPLFSLLTPLRILYTAKWPFRTIRAMRANWRSFLPRDALSKRAKKTQSIPTAQLSMESAKSQKSVSPSSPVQDEFLEAFSLSLSPSRADQGFSAFR